MYLWRVIAAYEYFNVGESLMEVICIYICKYECIEVVTKKHAKHLTSQYAGT